MPIELHNGYTGTKDAPLTLGKLQQLQAGGYSVMKTPHVGNQHPSNLLCAKLGFHLDMVTFTVGIRDVNFHPHLQIKDGFGVKLYSAETYTPFAKLADGQSAEVYHQASVRRVFPHLRVTTDIELLHDDTAFTMLVFRAGTSAVSQLWYRHTSSEGLVMKAKSPRRFDAFEGDIFRFSNSASGWVVPNKLSILYTLVWQSLSSGRDVVYALSGPDMVHYIGGLHGSLSAMYDALRLVRGGLPEVLRVFVVPVAQCRLLTHATRKDNASDVLDVIAWYEKQDSDKRQKARNDVIRVAQKYPEFIRPIAEGRFLSQYDLCTPDDLYAPQWLSETPLGRILSFARVMESGET